MWFTARVPCGDLPVITNSFRYNPMKSLPSKWSRVASENVQICIHKKHRPADFDSRGNWINLILGMIIAMLMIKWSIQMSLSLWIEDDAKIWVNKRDPRKIELKFIWSFCETGNFESTSKATWWPGMIWNETREACKEMCNTGS